MQTDYWTQISYTNEKCRTLKWPYSFQVVPITRIYLVKLSTKYTTQQTTEVFYHNYIKSLKYFNIRLNWSLSNSTSTYKGDTKSEDLQFNTLTLPTYLPYEDHKALLSQDSTCLEGHTSIAEGPTFRCKLTCYQRPPVLRDHTFMTNIF